MYENNALITVKLFESWMVALWGWERNRTYHFCKVNFTWEYLIGFKNTQRTSKNYSNNWHPIMRNTFVNIWVQTKKWFKILIFLKPYILMSNTLLSFCSCLSIAHWVLASLIKIFLFPFSLFWVIFICNINKILRRTLETPSVTLSHFISFLSGK